MTKARPGTQKLRAPFLFWIGAAAIVAGVFAVYSPSLDYPFILDDNRFIGDQRVQLPGHVWGYFTSAAWAQFAGGPTSFYRPLFVVWLRLNFILNEMTPWGWHFASVLKHIAVAVLLGSLVWMLLRDRMAALIAGGLFALHPAHTESVAWISVPDPLMSGAVLGSILLYLKYREFQEQGARSKEPESRGKKGGRKAHQTTRIEAAAGSGGAWLSMAWLMGSAALYFAALLVKETAIVEILMVLVLALPGKRVIREMAVFLGLTAVYFGMRLHALGGQLVAATQHMPWSTVVLSWPATLWFYVKVLVWPVRFRGFGNPSRADSFSVDGVLLPGLGVGCALLLLCGGLLWIWRKAGSDPGNREATGVKRSLLLGSLLVVLPLLPALDLNGLNPDDYLHGRYAYLSSAGLMLLAATGWHLAGKARPVLLAAAGAMAVAFAVLTVLQEPAWKSDMAVFTEGQRNAPRNAFVARNLVRSHVQEAAEWDAAGRCNEAVPVFEDAIRRYPDDWYGWAGLGDCLDQMGDLPKAEQALHRAADLAHQSRVTDRWQEVREKLEKR